MRMKILCSISVLFAAVGLTQAGLWDPAILNPSCESVENGGTPGNWGYIIDDWYENEQNAEGTPNAIWCYYEKATGIGLTGDGDLWFGNEAGGMFYQPIGTYGGDETFEITMLLGARGGTFGTNSISLYAGGVEADAADGTDLSDIAGVTLLDTVDVTTADGTSVETNVYEVTVELSTGTTATAGDLLWLEVGSVAGTDYFDYVRIINADPLVPVYVAPENDVEVPPSQVITWDQSAEAAALGTITYNVYVGTDNNSLSGSYYGLTPVKTSTTDPADFFYDADPDYPNGAPVDPDTWYWKVEAIEPNLVSPYTPIIHAGSEMTFTVEPETARVETDPVTQTVTPGTDTVLTITDINATTWQWYKDDSALTDAAGVISGSGTDTLTIVDTQLADEGFYHCEVDNSQNQPDTSGPARVMTERLVGWWKLDEATGLTLADSVQLEVPGAPTHDGTSVDPNWVLVAKDGAGIEFTGDPNQLVVIPDSNDYYNFYPQGMTASLWVKTASTGWNGVLSKQHRTGTFAGWTMDLTGGRASGSLRGSTGDLFGADDDGDIYDTEWHLVTYLIDRVSQTSRIYVDGLVRNETAVYTDTPTTNPRAILFGAEAEEGFLVNNTVIDDVKIWSYPLDEQTIADMYTDWNAGVWLCLNRPLLDTTGPDISDPPDGIGDPDCKVDLYELIQVVEVWLECGIAPASLCN